MPRPRSTSDSTEGRLGAAPPSSSSYHEAMEVTREQHYTTMDERSAISRNSSHSRTSTNSNRKKRFSSLLMRPKHQRGSSTPNAAMGGSSSKQEEYSPPRHQPQRGRAFSTGSSATSNGPGTPQRKHTTKQRSRSSSAQRPTQQSNKSPIISASPSFGDDNYSILSDNVTVEGLRSVATNLTVSSVETVKASNQTALESVQEESSKPPQTEIITKTPVVTTTTTQSNNNNNSSSSSKSAWKKFKRALKPFRTSSYPNVNEEKNGKSFGNHGTPEDTKKGNRRRVQSFDKGSSRNHNSSTTRSPSSSALFQNPALKRAKSGDAQQLRSSDPVSSAKVAEVARLDQSVRGRFDGVDVMTLGSALWVNSATMSTVNSREKPELPWNDTRYSVSGKSTLYSPAEMVKDMLWTSGGRTKPELILEGFFPGPEDRWSVQVESTENTKYAFTYALDSLGGPPALQPTSTDENTASTATDDHDSPLLSSHKLWTTLWGSDPVPSGQPNRELLTQVGNASGGGVASNKIGSSYSPGQGDDPLLSLAADSSIPIDIDEDTFIVSTRDHLMAVQNMASIPLSEGRFDTALRILEKLLLGLAPDACDERKYLRGATYHNIGLIHLWQGNYIEANSAFGEALKERRKHMTNHMDLVVTQCRQAQSLFALERFDESVGLLEACLKMSLDEDVIRAKLLNNLAIVHYHKQEDSKSLRHLARALEQQREWLDGTIRRESIVYDASVSLSNMGKVYIARADYESSCCVYEEALLLQTSIFQKDHPTVIQAYVNLAWSKALSGHNRTGLRLLESCLRVQTTSFGADASATVETAGWMAHLYARAGRYKDALPLYHRIRQWQKQHLKVNTPLFYITGSHTSTHPSVRLVKDCIKHIEKETVSKSSLTAWL